MTLCHAHRAPLSPNLHQKVANRQGGTQKWQKFPEPPKSTTSSDSTHIHTNQLRTDAHEGAQVDAGSLCAACKLGLPLIDVHITAEMTAHWTCAQLLLRRHHLSRKDLKTDEAGTIALRLRHRKIKKIEAP
eukprot:1140012-Pelagomonas_calceolata.AAC.5